MCYPRTGRTRLRLRVLCLVLAAPISSCRVVRCHLGKLESPESRPKAAAKKASRRSVASRPFLTLPKMRNRLFGFAFGARCCGLPWCWRPWPGSWQGPLRRQCHGGAHPASSSTAPAGSSAAAVRVARRFAAARRSSIQMPSASLDPQAAWSLRCRSTLGWLRRTTPLPSTCRACPPRMTTPPTAPPPSYTLRM